MASSPWIHYPARRIRAALNDILSRGYFERIWIVQENALASKITMKIDEHELTWLSGAETHRAICRIKFTAISPSWENAGLQDLDFRPLLEILEQNMMMTRMRMKKPCRAVTLLDLAYDLRYRKATDRRDMLFALRNMVPDEMKDSFVVDYSKPAEQLYADFFEFMKTAYDAEMDFVAEIVTERRKEEERQRLRSSAGW